MGAGTARIESERCVGDLRLEYVRGLGAAVNIILPNFSCECLCRKSDCCFANGDTVNLYTKNVVLYQRTGPPT